MQLFSEIEHWEKECMNLVEKPSYVYSWLHDLFLKSGPILYRNIHFLLAFHAALSVTRSLAERSLSALQHNKKL